NNLVRNAFEHTHTGQGPISILIKERELLITNQRNSYADEGYRLAVEASSHGYGLGLGIVQRLCERNGWSFVLQLDEKHVAARLLW
ncbi:MAG: ATP-binding protein, partial [Gammaproteobacteria bacterium]|nr:ATP-binding protein [Gammaproteobacteria bacterium]